MTPQATNRRMEGLTECYGRSWKLHAFTQKELDTMKAAHKLLGASTIGGWGVPEQGVVVEGVKGGK